MRLFLNSKILSALAVCVFLSASVLTNFLAQNSQSSPTPSPSPSPTATPTPARAPSPTPPPGAQNFHQWGSITVFNGLPSDSVRAISQTPDGVMWFGTDNGLARFDGRRVQNFAPGDADSNSVLVLETSPTGKLWIGTRAGAFVYAENRFQPVEGTQNVAITAILPGEEVFLGTDTGLVLRVNADDNGTRTAESLFLGKPILFTDGSPLAITSLIEHHGQVLAGTPGRGVMIIHYGPALGFPSSPRPLFVNSLVRSEIGTLWFGTDAAKGMSGIYELGNSSKAARITAPTANVLTLEANDGGLWAGTERYGLFNISESRLKKAYSFENTSGGLRSNTIDALFTDREGVLWIGTNRGVSRFDRLGPFQQTVSDIPNSNFIRTLFRAADGKIYAGSNRGLFVKDGDKWMPVAAHGNSPIYSIGEDRSGKMLVGTTEIIEPSPKLDTAKIGMIRRTFEGSDGAEWVADEHGVFRILDGRSERIIEAEDVRDVFVDGEHVWAATTTRGLLQARRDEQFGWLVSSVGFEQGLPSEKAFSILPIDEGLLIATNRGVVTYRPGTVAPKLIATRILSQRIHDLSELRSKINLEYPQNSLLIEVAGQSSRTFPEEFQYGFILKNERGEILDKSLSYASEYAPADLSSGNYIVEVQAFNRDLLASEPLTISFSIAPAPFPVTATALGVLLVLALVGLVWAVIAHRRVRQRNRELAAARLDLANEAERERSRVARDLHDQTLADLRSLMIASDRLLPDNPDFRSEIEAVSGEIRRICEDLSPSVLENVGLGAALEFLLGRTIENTKFTAAEDLEDKIEFPVNVRLQIYRIAQEVLTNIRSHSNADLVEMELEISADGHFQLTIRDNGDPFEPGRTLEGRGIANIKARAALINAQAAWNPQRAGNSFSLSVPK